MLVSSHVIRFYYFPSSSSSSFRFVIQLVNSLLRLSTHKTDFKTSNFYNKIPSRIQIRVAWCLSIYIKFVTFNVHITYNIYISCVYKTNLFMCIMIYFCWSMGIIKVAYTVVIHLSISIIIKINFRFKIIIILVF